jgi:hypothetical protein
MGTVGLNWQFSGVGNFSGRGTSDMILRDSNTGGLEVYDINNNAITNAAFIGTVGLDWRFSGVGNFQRRLRRNRSLVAQRQYRRIGGLRHQQQPTHGRRFHLRAFLNPSGPEVDLRRANFKFNAAQRAALLKKLSRGARQRPKQP